MLLSVEDDLALMVEGSDGRYYFQAGSICLAGEHSCPDCEYAARFYTFVHCYVHIDRILAND